MAPVGLVPCFCLCGAERFFWNGCRSRDRDRDGVDMYESLYPPFSISSSGEGWFRVLQIENESHAKGW